MTYQCTTEGCSLGDCQNCVAVAALRQDAEKWRAMRPEVERLRDFCVRVYDTLGLSHDCKPEYALSEIEALQDAARGEVAP